MGKIVRDKIPDIITASGKKAVFRVLTDIEYRDELFNKLKEEVEELCERRNSEEFADVLEVLKAIHYSDQKRYDSVFKESVRKRKEKGSFYNKIYLEEIAD